MDNKKDKKVNEFKIDLEKSWEDIGSALEEAKDKLQEITDDMIKAAKDIKKDFADKGNEDLDKDMKSYGKQISGSISTVIHENSPYLDEMFKGDSWKKVLKPDAPLPFVKGLKKEDKKNEK